MNSMARTSDRLFIETGKRAYYNIIKERYSHLKLTNSELFTLALVIGYVNGIKMPLIKKTGFIRHVALPVDFFSIMILLAIDEYGIDNTDWVNNPLILFDLAEEYANAGIDILRVYSEQADFDLEEFLTSNILDLDSTVDFILKFEKFIQDFEKEK